MPQQHVPYISPGLCPGLALDVSFIDSSRSVNEGRTVASTEKKKSRVRTYKPTIKVF